ncbi:MAG: ClpX C4-type zinc finger protein [Acidimicrobiales bacterium]
MFERFTDRASRVLVLAQEEARLLNHGFLGTEHMLLGLIQEGEGVAAQALAQLHISLEAARQQVGEIIGTPGHVPSGTPPFTPRAKKTIELSLREALMLGHNYIGTEHLLLGIVREGEGVGAQVLVALGADLERVRDQVILILGLTAPPASGGEAHPGTAMAMSSGLAPLMSEARVVACSFCGRRPPAAGRLVQGGESFICEHCIREWGTRLADGDAQ